MRQTIVVSGFLFYLFVICVQTAAADREFLVGVEGGINFADMTGEDYIESNTTRVGGAVGILVSVPPYRWIGMRTEFLYTQKGCTKSQTDSGLKYDVTYKWDYIEIPLLATISPPVSESFEIEAFIGLAAAFNVNAEIVGNVNNEGVETDFSDITNGSDFGVVLGFGCLYDIGSIKLLANIRGTFGFESIHNPIAGYSRIPGELPPAENIKNRVLTFMIGVAYPFAL